MFLGCSCIINRKPILAPFGFRQWNFQRWAGRTDVLSCLRVNLQQQYESMTVSHIKHENCTYMYTELPWFMLKMGIYLCCQKTIIYTMQTKIVYWSINAIAQERCTQKEQIIAWYSTTSFHSSGHSEMLFRVQYVTKASCKFHRNKHLLLISISTTDITLQAHLVPHSSIWPLVHNHEFSGDRKSSYSLPA